MGYLQWGICHGIRMRLYGHEWGIRHGQHKRPTTNAHQMTSFFFTSLAPHVFFPALPDKCETWSVNNWKLWKIEIKFPQKKETNNGQKPNKTSNTDTQAKHQARQTYQGNLQTKWNKWNIRAPLSPSNVLVHRVVLLQVVQWLDVSHIYICTWILRRVSYVWLQTSSLDLISALSSLPPFCTILHECINFRLRYCFLAW